MTFVVIYAAGSVESDPRKGLVGLSQSQFVQQSDMDKLKEFCTQKNMQVVNVPADGHCMFSSLAVQLGHPQGAAKDVRRELMEYLRTHPNIVSLALITDVLFLLIYLY